MRPTSTIAISAIFVCAFIASLPAQDFRLVRSLSGPSGRVQGARFVFDETRNRFVHPQDKSFVVFYEWEVPLGIHTLTALWKRPDGGVDSISPEVKIESTTRELTGYWTYTIYPEMAPGVWTLEVRIDGRPAGSHSFEIAGTGPAPPPPPPGRTPRAPTLDQIFQTASQSLVCVRRFDAAGKKADTASGFIFGKDRVLTALQVADGATKLEIEFAGGRKVETDAIANWSRKGDWAVIPVNTGDLPALQPGDSKLVRIGERQVVFNSEGGGRAIGGVDISGKRTVTGAGERIQFSPSISNEAAGGPLLDSHGRVIGILGGSLVPGERYDRHRMSIHPLLGQSIGGLNTATPISEVSGAMQEKSASTLRDLVDTGVLAAPLAEMDCLLYVQTSLEISAKANDPLPRDVYEFSRRDKLVSVISGWLKKGKVSKGLLSAKVYGEDNRVRVTVEPKKMSLQSSPIRSGFSFSPSNLTAGIYRIDLMWDGQAVWRTFIRVVD